MSVYVIAGGNPSFANGQLNAGGGVSLDRVTHLEAEVVMEPEVAGTLAKALRVGITRDASQGTAADMAGWKLQFAGGRAEKKMVKLTVMLVDDVSGPTPVLIGKLEAEEALVAGGDIQDHDSPTQTWEFTCNKYSYFNAVSGQKEPSDPKLVPVTVHGFSEAKQK
jgi:hypothetical protein